MSYAWAVVEHGVYYVDSAHDETRMMYFDFAGGKPAVVAAGLGSVAPLMTATADGRTILFARQDHSLQDLMLVEDFR
jgi:hypothetical protein